jgi:hypothetical protein
MHVNKKKISTQFFFLKVPPNKQEDHYDIVVCKFKPLDFVLLENIETKSSRTSLENKQKNSKGKDQ